ncbi:hypothetical protein [Lactobacillus sp. UCMA15818]|uniref:hypothetical protein n=1 Tax=Lactobacillus sp. UCMA15818 TaxID=2583394 RepID=UPI0025B0FBEA|nr:hypothetical protein [Lactobacillus sp. UCMA15818]MDN2452552.1 hypothetical protein [Lactobacillus sp. UCMA15818]
METKIGALLPNGTRVYEDWESNDLTDESYFLIEFGSQSADLVKAEGLYKWIEYVFETKLPNIDEEFCEGWLFANEINYTRINELEELE